MNVARVAYSLVLFGLGLGFGVFWSPLGVSRIGEDRKDTHAHDELEKLIGESRDQFGEPGEYFLSQFKDMTIRVKEYPIDAYASADGRFVIGLLGRDKTIASELRQIDVGGLKALNRHYTFSCGDLNYGCDFARSIDEGKMANVLFCVDVKGERKYSYFDRDADGLWDQFVDHTQEESKTYVREGLCWKRATIDAPKQADPR